MTGGRVGREPAAQEWRGSGRYAGLYLPADVHARAEQEYQMAAGARGAIDAAVAGASTQLDPSHRGAQIPPDESLKSWESYRRKVATAYQKGKPVEGGVVHQYDLHRYTYTFPPEQYAAGVEDCQRKLAEAGFTPEFGTNYWDCDQYKGVNTVWRHEGTGRQVEFQFHTPRSYEIKQETHDYYEVARATHHADGETEVSPDLMKASRWRSAEHYRSTEPGKECTIPPRHESVWPDRFERSRTKAPPGEALTTLDHEVAELRRERTAASAGQEGERGEGSRPPGLPERVRQGVQHDPAADGGWEDPGGGDRGPDRGRDE